MGVFRDAELAPERIVPAPIAGPGSRHHEGRSRRPSGCEPHALENSFWALPGQPQTEAPEAVVERVREAMLCALLEHLGPDGQAFRQEVHFALISKACGTCGRK